MKCNENDNSASAPIAPSPRIYKIQLTSPTPPGQEDSLTHLMLITVFFLTILTRMSPGALEQGWIPKLGRAPREI